MSSAALGPTASTREPIAGESPNRQTCSIARLQYLIACGVFLPTTMRTIDIRIIDVFRNSRHTRRCLGDLMSNSKSLNRSQITERLASLVVVRLRSRFGLNLRPKSFSQMGKSTYRLRAFGAIQCSSLHGPATGLAVELEHRASAGPLEYRIAIRRSSRCVILRARSQQGRATP